MSSHFEEKTPIEHVIEKRAEGVVALSESHGTEIPGHFSAAADALRETGVVFLLVWTLLTMLGVASAPFLFAFGCGWLVWKTGRSAWLGWARLERLHRVIEQEKYEIEHHRGQEREELTALYRAKGFEGELLERVIDVLMADGDRLLKVMLDEELGLTLEAYEHPLKQCLGAFIGTLIALGVIALLSLLPLYGTLIASFLLLGGGAILSAHNEGNQIIPAVVWNVSLGALSFGVVYFIRMMI